MDRKEKNPEMTRDEIHLRFLYSSSYKPANEPYECPRGMVVLGIAKDAYNYEGSGGYQGTYRLRSHPDLKIPIDGFVGKQVGIKGIFTDQFANEHDVKNLVQIVEVREFYNHYYPDEEIRESSRRHRAREPLKLIRISDLDILCAHCGGETIRVAFKSDVEAHPEQYQNILCPSCSELHPSAITGMNFTQEQLEAMWKQMTHERKQDSQQADRMLTWMCEQTAIDRKHASFSRSNEGVADISPWTLIYHFVLTHQTYGPYLQDFIDALTPQPWAKHIRGAPSGPVYEVVTPEGTYEVHFSYFDNHGSGW